MDRDHHGIFNRLRKRLSFSVPSLSPNPGFRRRLYGALFLVTALTLGAHSSQAIQQEAIRKWITKTPPPLSVWQTTAQSRGLQQLLSSNTLGPWQRLMPREFTPNTAWWDDLHQALWVMIPADGLPEVVLFARSLRPTRATAGPRPLGYGWEALEAFLRLPSSVPTRKPGALAKAPRSDPRVWNF